MTDKEYLEYALSICNMEIKKDSPIACTNMDKFNRLIGIKRGLITMHAVITENWTDDIKRDFIRNMIENF